MKKDLYYNSVADYSVKADEDPYRRPSFSRAQRAVRLLWTLVWIFLYRPTPRPAHFWRAFLLRLFGAKLGPGCRFYPASKVWAPWNLVCEDVVTVGDGAEVYNQAPIHLGSHAIISQGAYLCASTHDFNDPGFPLLAYPMKIGRYAWVAARAVVGPKVDVGEGAVLGLASVATRDLEPWSVYAGVPATRVKERNRFLEKV
jgi:putative colanic acid biosynthesis acetyltransferase WcaF